MQLSNPVADYPMMWDAGVCEQAGSDVAGSKGQRPFACAGSDRQPRQRVQRHMCLTSNEQSFSHSHIALLQL